MTREEKREWWAAIGVFLVEGRCQRRIDEHGGPVPPIIGISWYREEVMAGSAEMEECLSAEALKWFLNSRQVHQDLCDFEIEEGAFEWQWAIDALEKANDRAAN